MVMWELVTVVLGVAYGALKRGRQDKSTLLKQGLLIGLVLALILALIGWATGHKLLGFGSGLALLIAALVLSLLFVLGVWIGDLVTRGR